MEPDASHPTILRTPLHGLHLRRGAKMVPFAGYEMPLAYPAGLMREHLHTREAAGLFDVSHMGQVDIVPRSGNLSEAARALESLVPIDVLGLPPGRQRYGFLTNDSGGILDDLMVANLGDRLRVVVNAANKAADVARLREVLSEWCEIALLPRALVALQGPQAAAVLQVLAPAAAAMRFMDAREMEVGARALVTRSGYTGEDGFEISVAADDVEALADALLADARVLPVGLGARDSLRLEAGLCLHGADIDATTTPADAGLAWAIPKVRRSGGARAGGFPGAARILAELELATNILPRCTGEDARRRVGLRPEGRAPVRAGAPLYASDAASKRLGIVTSGGFGPSVGAPVAMGYVPVSLAAPGTRLFTEVRGQRLPVIVSQLPFVPAGFKRG